MGIEKKLGTIKLTSKYGDYIGSCRRNDKNMVDNDVEIKIHVQLVQIDFNCHMDSGQMESHFSPI